MEASALAPVGMSRVIRPSTSGLKTLVDVGHEPWKADGVELAFKLGIEIKACWDIATLAVAQHARRSRSDGLVALALYHALYRCSVANDIRHWTAILDDRVLHLLLALDLRFQRLGDLRSRPYFGSESSTPVFACVAEVERVLQASNPAVYAMLGRGQGLEAVEMPSQWDLGIAI